MPNDAIMLARDSEAKSFLPFKYALKNVEGTESATESAKSEKVKEDEKEKYVARNGPAKIRKRTRGIWISVARV